MNFILFFGIKLILLSFSFFNLKFWILNEFLI